LKLDTIVAKNCYEKHKNLAPSLNKLIDKSNPFTYFYTILKLIS